MNHEPYALSVPADAGLRAEVAGPVATITLNRPGRRNCQTPHTWAALAAVARGLPGSVRVVVLRGEGPAFSAGLDRAMFTPEGVPGAPGLAALAAAPAAQAHAQIAAFQRAFDWTSRPALVSIAAVQGHAVGAGFQLALGADLRIVADDVQFCMAEPTLGLVPDLGGTKRLVGLIGYARAAEICLTGRRVGAAEACTIGLAARAVPPGELPAAVQQTVDALLAVPAAAAAETKALLLHAAGRSQGDQEAAERAAQYRRLRELAGLDAEDC